MPHTRSGSRRFLPASVLALRQYTPQLFVSDLIAGITVGLVALPLAMAFAISSGMSPQAGIYCAVATGFIISALGGSYVQIGGPTGAFVVVVSGIVAKYGVDGLFMCTMMAGVVLVIMGVTGSGTAVRFIPRPVVIGFTNGIALVIASTQIKDFFGITLVGPVPGELVPRMAELAMNADAASLPTTLVAAGVFCSSSSGIGWSLEFRAISWRWSPGRLLSQPPVFHSRRSASALAASRPVSRNSTCRASAPTSC